MVDAKFRVWKNVRSAFGGLWETLSALEWYPVIAFFLLFVLTEVDGFVSLKLQQMGFIEIFSPSYEELSLEIFSPSAQLYTVIYTAVWFYAVAPLGVAIHRQVLLSESPTKGYFKMYGEGRVHKFVAVGFIFSMIFRQVPSFMVTFTYYEYTIFDLNRGAVMWLFLGSLVAARIALVLPAIAIDAHDPRVNKAWHDTHGNTWRIWFGITVVLLPFLILYRFLPAVVESAIPGKLAIDLIIVVVWLVQIAVSIRFLSLVFRDRASLLTSTSA